MTDKFMSMFKHRYLHPLTNEIESLQTATLGITEDGHGPVKRWEYGTVSDGDSANFVRETKMLSATGGVAACAFYDGLGRQWQSASEGAAPGGGAVCAITEYDLMGRKSAEWMPADASGSAFGSAEEFKAASASLHGDSCARTDYGYGLTQGSEPDTVTRPGSLLRESGASIVTERLVNEEEGLLSCMDLRVSATGRLVKKGVHAPGRLAVTVTTDEDGRQALSFANLFGEKVMERRVMGDGEYADTYFVSDGHGDLRYMVPPMLADAVASAADGTEWDASDTEFARYAYCYEYNRAGKPTVKKLPGREAVEYVYDEGMRPVLWRDGNLRAAGKWAYRILDAHMRPALEGEAEMEDGVAAAFGGCTPTAKADSSKPLGYAVVGLPKGADLGEADLATYYDDYSFIGDAEGFGSAPSSAHGSAKGRMTGRRVNGRLEACYYDLAGNLVATCAENRFGHVDTTSTDYSYSGQPLEVTTSVKGPDGKTVRHIGSTEYDSVGRPVRTKSRLMSDLKTVETSAMSYGACGRLSSAMLGATEVGYGYDCQGRLAEIASAPFSLGVGYEDGLCMGGDVTSVTWNYGGESRTMAYAYDRLDRLVSASLNGLPLSAYSYDKHSSPLSVVRHGVDPSAAAERLSYGYDGNLLVSLSDSRGSHTLGWDANGNLSTDSSRGIESISYDRNNLPKRVDLAGGEWIEFGYDALGRKHSQVRRDDDFGSIVAPPIVLNAEVAQPLAGGATEIDPIKPVDPIGPIRPFGEKSRVDYAGNCVYEDRALKMVLIPEGYIKADGIVGEYRYYVRDHQGNVRAVVDGDGNLVEANDYYPYGLPMPAAGGLAGDAQPYKYGGKELLSACHGGESGADALTGLYDFGPRWQSSPTALWAQPDPEAESYPGISPYAYCAANPARYVDPTGSSIFFMEQDGKLVKVGSDGKDDGRLFIVHSCLGYEMQENNGVYKAEAGNAEFMAEITHIKEFDVIEKAIGEANADGRERGMNKDENGAIQKWEKGSEVTKDENGKAEHGMQPFNIKGRENDLKSASKSQWYMHVHPVNNATSSFGSSQPSSSDTGFDSKFRGGDNPFKGSTFVVGGGDKKVTFYHGENLISTFPLQQLKDLINRNKN